MKYILCIFVVALLHFVDVNGQKDEEGEKFHIHKCVQDGGDINDCLQICKNEVCDDSDEPCKKGCQNNADIINECKGKKDECCNADSRGQTWSQFMQCYAPKGLFKGIPPLGGLPVKKRRRRQAITLKENDPFFVKFNKLFIKHPDLPDKLLRSKKRKCCATASQVIPFTTKIAKNVYPVYCPISGGYQFIDKVDCHVQKRDDMIRYGMVGPSFNPKKCKVKKCQRICTMRTYLVTNLKPLLIWGHCFFPFLPVWFRNVNVPSHCICPRSKWVKDEC